MEPTTQTAQRIIEIEGDMDALMVKQFRANFEDVVDNDDCNVTIDMTRVDFIDSSGIGALVFLFKRLLAAGRNLQIIGVHGQPLDLFEFLRIDKSISVQSCDTPIKEDTAIAGATR